MTYRFWYRNTSRSRLCDVKRLGLCNINKAKYINKYDRNVFNINLRISVSLLVLVMKTSKQMASMEQEHAKYFEAHVAMAIKLLSMIFVLILEKQPIRALYSYIKWSDWMISEYEYKTSTGELYDNKTWSQCWCLLGLSNISFFGGFCLTLYL